MDIKITYERTISLYIIEYDYIMLSEIPDNKKVITATPDSNYMFDIKINATLRQV